MGREARVKRERVLKPDFKVVATAKELKTDYKDNGGSEKKGE